MSRRQSNDTRENPTPQLPLGRRNPATDGRTGGWGDGQPAAGDGLAGRSKTAATAAWSVDTIINDRSPFELVKSFNNSQQYAQTSFHLTY